MTATGDSPKVSIAIPLYRGLPFVDNLVGDLEGVEYQNLEILFADHHLEDNALEVLRARLVDDPRVRFFESTDQITWFENYNFLMKKATGTYFRLLAQDDRLPPSSISAAVERLEQEPETVLIYGPVDVIDGSGVVVFRSQRQRKRHVTHRLIEPLTVFGGWRSDAMLGVVRRGTLADDGLFIEPTWGHTGLSATACQFAISLRGALRYVSAYENQRRVHEDRFTAKHWDRSLLDQIRRLASYYRLGLRIFRRHKRGILQRAVAVPVLFVVGVVVLPTRRLLQRLTPRTQALLSAGGRRAPR